MKEMGLSRKFSVNGRQMPPFSRVSRKLGVEKLRKKCYTANIYSYVLNRRTNL